MRFETVGVDYLRNSYCTIFDLKNNKGVYTRKYQKNYRRLLLRSKGQRVWLCNHLEKFKNEKEYGVKLVGHLEKSTRKFNIPNVFWTSESLNLSGEVLCFSF